MGHKRRVLHPGRSNAKHQYGLGADLLGSSAAEGALVDSKLSMSLQGALRVRKANWYPRVHEEERGQQGRGRLSSPSTLPW